MSVADGHRATAQDIAGSAAGQATSGTTSSGLQDKRQCPQRRWRGTSPCLHMGLRGAVATAQCREGDGGPGFPELERHHGVSAGRGNAAGR